MNALEFDLQIPTPVGIINAVGNFELGKNYGLVGANGIGKTCFIHYIKIHQKRLFPNLRLSFVDQWPLSPLGDIRPIDILEGLKDNFSKHLVWQNLHDFDLIETLGLANKLKTPVNRLSGGENQSLKILCALSFDSHFYFLDEPFHYLDQHKRQWLAKWIEDTKSRNKSIVLVEHRTDEVMQLCDEVYCFERQNSQIVLRRKALGSERVEL